MTTPPIRRGIKLKEEPETGEQAFEREVTTRLRRIESRLVSGMNSLGAGMANNAAGITVTPPELTSLRHEVGLITITSLGTTVKNLLDAIGTDEGTYDISYNGVIKCQITTSNR